MLYVCVYCNPCIRFYYHWYSCNKNNFNTSCEIHRKKEAAFQNSSFYLVSNFISKNLAFRVGFMCVLFPSHVLQTSPVSITPPIVHSHSFIYHWRYIILNAVLSGLNIPKCYIASHSIPYFYRVLGEEHWFQSMSRRFHIINENCCGYSQVNIEITLKIETKYILLRTLAKA